MSETLLLVIPEVNIDLTGLRSCLESEFMVSGDVKSLTVGHFGAREKVFVVQVLDFVSDGVFEDWPEDRIPWGPVSVFSFDYKSAKLVLDIVHALAPRFGAIVDTNFGSVVSLGDLTIGHLLQDLA